MSAAAGSLSTRVRIERRGDAADDGLGNIVEDWAPLATRWARWSPQYGREAVAAGRLEASRPGVLTLRRDTVTASIGAADRVVFLTGPEATDTPAAIRSVLPLVDVIEITVEIGVAT